ncbi:hypothetical protein [Paenibacillus peoriae]|nr:hypothetical protein [Paenibacillus peoriae]
MHFQKNAVFVAATIVANKVPRRFLLSPISASARGFIVAMKAPRCRI